MARGGKSYLLIDHRAGGGGMQEMSTVTCCHCNRAVILNPLRQRERGYCRRCDAYRCDSPGCAVDCTPFAQTIDILMSHPNESVMILDQHGLPIVRPELREADKIY